MKNTFCIFTEVEKDVVLNRKPDYVSVSGSQYFFEQNGVYRLSDHWGRTANSKWRLIPLDDLPRKIKVGFAKNSDFHKDSLTEKIYFIEADFSTQSVYFNHKNNLPLDSKAVLRTSTETTKIIRQIRKLFENKNWTKYYSQLNILELIVNDLIETEKTLEQLKQFYLKVL
jgi:hypothetical protein